MSSVFPLHWVALHTHWISPAILLPAHSLSSKLSFSTTSRPCCPESLHEHHTVLSLLSLFFQVIWEHVDHHRTAELLVTSLFCQGWWNSTSFPFLNCFPLKLQLHSFFSHLRYHYFIKAILEIQVFCIFSQLVSMKSEKKRWVIFTFKLSRRNLSVITDLVLIFPSSCFHLCLILDNKKVRSLKSSIPA